MTTRIALPFTLGFKMSGTRRQGPPDPLPQTSQVRKNLFGPIDHEENMKFVQDELSKISQADCKRWNFDFQAEKPKEGRYSWEPVSGSVPQAYEMRAMSCTHSQPTGASEQPATTQPIEKQPEKPRLPTVPDQQPTTDSTAVTTAVSAAVTTAVSTAAATTVTATTRKRKTQDRGGGTVKKVKLGATSTTATTAATTAATTTTATTSTADKRNVKSSQQPSISAYMSIRRRVPSLPKTPKEPPPSLLKKSQTSQQPSPPSPSS